MENKLIMFGSMTPMMRARELLRRHGIRGITVRTPAHLRRNNRAHSRAFASRLLRLQPEAPFGQR